jgi:hypothetical protein
MKHKPSLASLVSAFGIPSILKPTISTFYDGSIMTAPLHPSRITKLSYTGRLFRAHALAVGQLTLAWNSLHEQLGKLFWTICGGDGEVILSAWHSLISDKSQRDMLRAAAKARFGDGVEVKKILELLELINKASDMRNAAVHGPMTLGFHDGKWSAAPDHLFGNRRAKQLLQYDQLQEELRCTTDTLVSLRDYIAQIDGAINGFIPWPASVPRRISAARSKSAVAQVRKLQSPSRGSRKSK